MIEIHDNAKRTIITVGKTRLGYIKLNIRWARSKSLGSSILLTETQAATVVDALNYVLYGETTDEPIQRT